MAGKYFKRNRFTYSSALIALVLSAVIFCSKNSAGPEPEKYVPPPLTNTTWQMISNPDSAGWSSEKLQAAYEYSKGTQTAAVMIIYDGKVLYHWGEISRRFWIHSCRKSLMSALYGIHVKNGNIDLDKTMGELGIDDNPPSLTDEEKIATVRMLIKARSGVYHPAAAEAPSMRAARPERYSHAPGTFWYYNNWDFNALGTVFEQETGTKIFEEFKAKIADPVGMEDFRVDDGIYQYEDYSIHPAYHFRLTARDMARFGLLFLRNGMWNEEEIISEDWIEESTTSYSDAGDSGGYGYMWWIAVDGKHVPFVALNDAFSARGYGGHFVLVIPEMDVVIVHRVNTDINNSVSGIESGVLVSLILDAKN
ncbi:serine hydrolase domain-containing protein [candidate division KSB1 bacterium]